MTNYEFVIDQLSNNETASDEEMAEHLSRETGKDKNAIKRLIKNERTKFMNDPFIDTEKALRIITSYI